MNTNKTFIGAYARNRRGSQQSGNSPSPRQSIPAPHLAPSPLGDSDPEQRLPNTDEASAAETLVQARPDISDALSYSEIIAETAEVWIDQPQGQVFRFDTPAVPAPAGRAIDQPVIAEPEAAESEAAAAYAIPSAEPIAAPRPTVHQPAVEAPVAEAPADQAPTVEMPTQRVTEPIRPAPATPVRRWQGAAWEVDAFDIPNSVAELFFDEDFFRSIAEHIGESVRDGLRSVLVTSIAAGAGRSTVAIGTAIAAAAAGIRVALIDVDLDSPSQADQLRLEIETDWVSAIRQGERLENAAIASLEDNVTLLPLVSEDRLPVTSMEIDRLIESLDGCFDLLMFDGTVMNSWSTGRIAASVDSCLIVRDTRSTSKSEVAFAAEKLRGRGVKGIGVIDNFCG